MTLISQYISEISEYIIEDGIPGMPEELMKGDLYQRAASEINGKQLLALYSIR